MRGRAMSEIQLSELDRVDWQEAVRQIAMEYGDSYAKHPRLIPLFTSHSVRDQTTLRVYDALTEAFAMAGFEPKERLQANTIIDSFVLGSALDATAPSAVWEADTQSSHAFTEALSAGLQEPNRAEQTFFHGLTFIIQSLTGKQKKADS
jgi:DNA primase